MRKNQTISSLRKLCWDKQSRLMRQNAANFQGNVVCYTCGKVMPWKEADLGHFKHLDALDFEKNNLRIQCTKCNRFLHGNSGVFAVRLAKEVGLKEVERLVNFRKLADWKVSELNKLNKKLTEALKEI